MPNFNKCGVWGNFFVGDAVMYHGRQIDGAQINRKARVAMAVLDDVPERYVPIIFEDSDNVRPVYVPVSRISRVRQPSC